MAYEVLQGISRHKHETTLVNRLAMQKRIPRIGDIYQEITGITRNQIFFQRQAGMTDDSKDRRNDYERFLEIFLAASFAEKRRGDFYVEHFNTVVEWRNRQAGRISLKRDFWQAESDADSEFSNARRSFVTGDLSDARKSIFKAILALRECLEIVSEQNFDQNEYFPLGV